MKTFYTILVLLLFSTSYAYFPALTPPQEEGNLVVNNRILAKVGDKTISVIDVMKKMDVMLMRAYPHLINSPTARYQFYTSQWRSTLTQMIDTELILTDAERIELKVSDGDVRETMLERFAPNMMTTLDKLGLSYEEARKMIHSELVMQRMTWYRVNAKALSKVHSPDIKAAYLTFRANHPPLEEWKYEVLSIRSDVQDLSAAIAHKACALLEQKQHAAAVASILKEQEDISKNATIVSQEYQANEKTVSLAHKEALQGLSVGDFSKPLAQLSRADQSIVYRIFHLKEHTKAEIPSFEKAFDKLHEELLEQAANEENTLYTAKLRERFGYDDKMLQENIPSDFQPFSFIQ